MKKVNTLIWITLLLLSCLGFFLSEQAENATKYSTFLVMAVAGGKTMLVTQGYMELRQAPRIWNLAILGLIGSLLCMVILLS